MSEEKMEHSPLPWYVDDDDCVCDANHIVVGDTGYGERQLPDARLIVTAVNSYYDNKAAIAELVEALERTKENLHEIEAGDMSTYEAQDQLDALIAKHKAGKP